MTTEPKPEPEHEHDGVELVLEEVREEAGRLLTHPVQEVVRVEHVAADGESAATPLILVIGVMLLVAFLFVVVLGIALAFTDLFG
jgi:hypothetical protein